jgi:hypothetical protein
MRTGHTGRKSKASRGDAPSDYARSLSPADFMSPDFQGAAEAFLSCAQPISWPRFFRTSYSIATS